MARPEVVGDGLGGVALPAHGDGAGGLGEPVGGEDGGEGELAAHAVDELDGDHGRAGDGQAQAREVVVGTPGMGQDRLVERGRSREHRDALAATVARTLSTSKTGSGTMVAPCMRHAMMPAL